MSTAYNTSILQALSLLKEFFDTHALGRHGRRSAHEASSSDVLIVFLYLLLAKELSDGLLVGTTRNHHNNKIFLHAYQQWNPTCVRELQNDGEKKRNVVVGKGRQRRFVCSRQWSRGRGSLGRIGCKKPDLGELNWQNRLITSGIGWLRRLRLELAESVDFEGGQQPETKGPWPPAVGGHYFRNAP